MENKIPMHTEEIVALYNAAEDKRAKVIELASMNNVSESRIIDELKKGGVNWRTLPRGFKIYGDKEPEPEEEKSEETNPVEADKDDHKANLAEDDRLFTLLEALTLQSMIDEKIKELKKQIAQWENIKDKVWKLKWNR